MVFERSLLNRHGSVVLNQCSKARRPVKKVGNNIIRVSSFLKFSNLISKLDFTATIKLGTECIS